MEVHTGSATNESCIFSDIRTCVFKWNKRTPVCNLLNILDIWMSTLFDSPCKDYTKRKINGRTNQNKNQKFGNKVKLCCSILGDFQSHISRMNYIMIITSITINKRCLFLQQKCLWGNNNITDIRVLVWTIHTQHIYVSDGKLINRNGMLLLFIAFVHSDSVKQSSIPTWELMPIQHHSHFLKVPKLD